MGDMMHPVWEVRHGAVLGLRELLRWQAASAGIRVSLVQDVPSGWAVSGKSTLRDIEAVSENDLGMNRANNRECLEDCCLKLLELIVLDRMGDYLSDQMVAPVRETASQAFGCCLSSLPLETIRHFLVIIDQMVKNIAWEVRYSGYTLLKYLTTTTKELTVDDRFMICVLRGLEDNMDDVRAVAADVLVPIATNLSILLSPMNMSILRSVLWSNLAEVDDLSAATPGILHLLWKLYTTDSVGEDGVKDLRDRLPLLFPFFQHPLASVRTSAVQCFRQLLTFRSEVRPVFRKALCLIYFSLLTEVKGEILKLNEDTWQELLEAYEMDHLINDFSDALLEVMVHLACTPIGTSFDQEYLEQLVDCVEEQSGERLTVGSQFAGNPFRMRFAACRALALLFRQLPQDSEREKILISAAQSMSATSQLVAALIGHFWFAINTRDGIAAVEFPQICLAAVSSLLESDVAFSELLGYEIKLRNEFSSFFTEVSAKIGVETLPDTAPLESMSPQEMENQSRCLLFKLGPLIDESIAGLQQHVASTSQTIIELRQVLRIQIHACVASVLVDTGEIPSKLNRTVQPLMAGVRTEKEVLLQNLFADRLAQLIILCHHRKSAVRKMIENVCTMACEGIVYEDKSNLSAAIEKQGLNPALGVMPASALDLQCTSRRGAEKVLCMLARDLSDGLFTMLPALWTEMAGALNEGPMQAVRSIEVIQIVGTHVCAGLLAQLSALLVQVCHLCFAQTHSLRIASSRCCAALVVAHTEVLFPAVLEELIPCLSVSCDAAHREGAVIALHHTLEALGLCKSLQWQHPPMCFAVGASVVPYIVLLIVPLLALMSDYSYPVRIIAASCFGKLTSLLPLMCSTAPPPNLSSTQAIAFQQNASFVAQLIDNKKTLELNIPEGVSVELRGYQKEGISWMTFLRRFGLHGILADDMGLGKTIQTLITILLSKTESTDTANGNLPSLVACPATLISHWRNEVMTVIPSGSLKPLLFVLFAALLWR